MLPACLLGQIAVARASMLAGQLSAAVENYVTAAFLPPPV